MDWTLLKTSLHNGSIVPFLGAGCSIPSGLPTAAKLAATLSKGAPVEARSCYCCCETCATPPLSLDTAASYFQSTWERRSLEETVAAQITSGGLSPIHKCLASVSKPMLIITTNYDELLEQAFADRSFEVLILTPVQYETAEPIDELFLRHYRDGVVQQQLEVSGDDLARHINLEERSLIFKIHGSLFGDQAHSPGKFLITEEDYERSILHLDQFLPPAVLEHLDGRRLLFLGYSLRDWNVRALLHRLIGYVRPKSFAITRSATQLDRELWLARHLDITTMDIDDFVERLNRGS